MDLCDSLDGDDDEQLCDIESGFVGPIAATLDSATVATSAAEPAPTAAAAAAAAAFSATAAAAATVAADPAAATVAADRAAAEPAGAVPARNAPAGPAAATAVAAVVAAAAATPSSAVTWLLTGNLALIFANVDVPQSLALVAGVRFRCADDLGDGLQRFYIFTTGKQRARPTKRHPTVAGVFVDGNGQQLVAGTLMRMRDQGDRACLRAHTRVVRGGMSEYDLEVNHATSLPTLRPNCAFRGCKNPSAHGAYCSDHKYCETRPRGDDDDGGGDDRHGGDSGRGKRAAVEGEGGLPNRNCDIAWVFPKRDARELILPGHVVALVERPGGVCATRFPAGADGVDTWLVCANDPEAPTHYEPAWQWPSVRDPSALRGTGAGVALVLVGVAMVRSDEVRDTGQGRLYHEPSRSHFVEFNAIRAPCQADANVKGVPVFVNGDAWVAIDTLTMSTADAIAIVRAHTQRSVSVRPVLGKMTVEFATRRLRLLCNEAQQEEADSDGTADGDGNTDDEDDDDGNDADLWRHVQAYSQQRLQQQQQQGQDEDEQQQDEQDEGIGIDALVTLLRQKQSVVVMGAAGLGKSTLCREVVRRGNAPAIDDSDDECGSEADGASDTAESSASAEGRGDHSDYDGWVFMPTVRLRDVETLEPVKLLKAVFGKQKARLLWKALCNHERVVWAFDGFEELGSDSGVAEQLRDADWARVKLITTRVTECAVLHGDDVVLAELLPLSRAAVLELVTQSLDASRAQDLHARLRADPRLAELMTSPLLCAIVCHLFASDAGALAGASASFANIISWAVRAVAESGRQHSVDVRVERARHALEQHIPADALRELCTQALQQFESNSSYGALDVSHAALQECGLLVLVPQSLGRYEFAHASFLEYFACRAAVEHKQRDVLAFMAAHLENASVMEMLRHFVSDGDAPRFVAAAVEACVARGGLRDTGLMSQLRTGAAPAFCASLCAAISGPADGPEAVAMLKARLLPYYHASVRLVAEEAFRRGQLELWRLLNEAAPQSRVELLAMVKELIDTKRGDELLLLRPHLLLHQQFFQQSFCGSQKYANYFDKTTCTLLPGLAGLMSPEFETILTLQWMRQLARAGDLAMFTKALAGQPAVREFLKCGGDILESLVGVCGDRTLIFELGATLEVLAECALGVPEFMDVFVLRHGGAALDALAAVATPAVPREGEPLARSVPNVKLAGVQALSRHNIRISSARINPADVAAALTCPNVDLHVSTLYRVGVALPAAAYIAFPDRRAVFRSLWLLEPALLDEVVPYVLAPGQAVDAEGLMNIMQQRREHLLQWLGRLGVVPDSRADEVAAMALAQQCAHWWPANTIAVGSPPASLIQACRDFMQRLAHDFDAGALSADDVMASIEAAAAKDDQWRAFLGGECAVVAVWVTMWQPPYRELRQQWGGPCWPQFNEKDVVFLARFFAWHARVFGPTLCKLLSRSLRLGKLLWLVPPPQLPRFVRSAADWLELATTVAVRVSGTVIGSADPVLSPVVAGELITCCMLHFADDGPAVVEDAKWRKSVWDMVRMVIHRRVEVNVSAAVWMLQWLVANVPAGAGEESATATALSMVLWVEDSAVARDVLEALLHSGLQLHPTEADWHAVFASPAFCWCNHWRTLLAPYCCGEVVAHLTTHCGEDDVRDFVRQHPAWLDRCLHAASFAYVPLLLGLGASPVHRLLTPIVEPPLPGAVATTAVSVLRPPDWASNASEPALAHLDAFVREHRAVVPNVLPVQCDVGAEVAAVLARHGIKTDRDAGMQRLADARLAAAKAAELAAALADIAARLPAAVPAAPAVRPLAEWTVDEVCDLWASFGATAAHLDTLRAEHVNGKALMLLSAAELRSELKLPLGPCAQFADWLARHQSPMK